jgi:hypothetical protein
MRMRPGSGRRRTTPHAAVVGRATVAGLGRRTTATRQPRATLPMGSAWGPSLPLQSPARRPASGRQRTRAAGQLLAWAQRRRRHRGARRWPAAWSVQWAQASTRVITSSACRRCWAVRAAHQVRWGHYLGILGMPSAQCSPVPAAVACRTHTPKAPTRASHPRPHPHRGEQPPWIRVRPTDGLPSTPPRVFAPADGQLSALSDAPPRARPGRCRLVAGRGADLCRQPLASRPRRRSSWRRPHTPWQPRSDAAAAPLAPGQRGRRAALRAAAGVHCGALRGRWRRRKGGRPADTAGASIWAPGAHLRCNERRRGCHARHAATAGATASAAAVTAAAAADSDALESASC